MSDHFQSGYDIGFRVGLVWGVFGGVGVLGVLAHLLPATVLGRVVRLFTGRPWELVFWRGFGVVLALTALFSVLFLANDAHAWTHYYADRCGSCTHASAVSSACRINNVIVPGLCRYQCRLRHNSNNNSYYACDVGAGQSWATYDVDLDGDPNGTDPDPYDINTFTVYGVLHDADITAAMDGTITSISDDIDLSFSAVFPFLASLLGLVLGLMLFKRFLQKASS